MTRKCNTHFIPLRCQGSNKKSFMYRPNTPNTLQLPSNNPSFSIPIKVVPNVVNSNVPYLVECSIIQWQYSEEELQRVDAVWSSRN